MDKKREKYIVLKGCGGLGNRIITLMCAINYAKRTNRKLYVDWADGMFGALGDNVFFHFFELKNIDYTKSGSEIEEYLQNGATAYPRSLTCDDLRLPILNQFYSLTPFLAKFPIYKVGMSLLFRHKLGYLVGVQSFQRINKKKKYWGAIRDIFLNDNFPLGGNLSTLIKSEIVLFADFRPLCRVSPIFNYLTLREMYLMKFIEFAKENNFQDVIGVHVRYTDKKPKAQLNRLLDKLDKDIKTDIRKKIFLTSDNNDIIEEFKNHFEDKLLLYPKFIPRVENGGIHMWAERNCDTGLREKLFEDSIADMWLLSMTKQLYWQGNSSFSYISKLIKNDQTNTFDWLKL